jgi:hypothetical protein
MIDMMDTIPPTRRLSRSLARVWAVFAAFVGWRRATPALLAAHHAAACDARWRRINDRSPEP